MENTLKVNEYEDIYCEIQLDRDASSLDLIFKPEQLPTVGFRHILETYLFLYIQYKRDFPRLQGFYDVREMHPIDPEAVELAAFENTPMLLKAGMTKEAFLVPEDVFTQINVSDYQELANQMDTQNFQTEAEAKAWLQAK